MSTEEWVYYQRTAGRKTQELLTELFYGPEPLDPTVPVEVQREIVEKAIGSARQYAAIMARRRRAGEWPLADMSVQDLQDVARWRQQGQATGGR